MSKMVAPQTMALAVAAAVQAMALPSVAQDQEAFSLEEIIVTAQKREQSLQDVPSTVNAISGNDLTDLKLFNFNDLEQVSPGLDMRNVNGRAGSIALRGVDFNPNSGASPAVDVYWNDVTLGANATGGVFQEMFDLERVEVLRGPQGALQGRTSPAGAISLQTAVPDMEEVEGYVRTTMTESNGSNTQFAASLPIIPGQLAIRVAGVYNDSELSEIENLVDGDISDTQTRGGRLTVVWEPTESLSVKLAYQNLENDLSANTILSGSPTLGQGLPDLSGSDFNAIALLPDHYKGRFENTSLKVEWEVMDHMLTFVSGYSETTGERRFDSAEGNTQEGYTPFPAGALAAFPQLGFSGSQLNDPRAMLDQNYASSQELRLSSISNDFWDYTVGVYYGNESGYFNQELMREQVLQPGVSAFFDTEALAPFNVQSYGVFSHNIFYLTDQLTAQAALRWQRLERSTSSALFAAEDVFTPLTAPAPTLAEGTQLAQLVPDDLVDSAQEAWTGSLSLQYELADYDVVLYANAATSFRPGGTTVAATDLGELTEYNEEDSWSTEIGMKSKWLDGQLRFNAAAFYQDYSDYIGRVSRVVLSGGRQAGGITTNGDARVQGVELDVEYLLAHNWRISGGVSYVEAEYKDGAEIPCNGPAIPAGATAATCDVGGLELGTQPRLSANLSTDYSVTFDSVEGYVAGLYKFTGRRTDVDAPSGDLGGYGTFDLHIGVRDLNSVWDVSLFARNLFDKDATENVQPEFRTFTGVGTGYSKVQQVSPQLVGVSATYHF